MKRLESKCLFASAVTHALLLGMVLIGSAFIRHEKPPEIIPMELVTIPDLLIDAPNMVGGGNPKAGLPDAEPAPAQPRPQPPAPQRQEPAPAPVQPRTAEPEPRPVQPEPKPEVKPIVVPDPKPIVKPADTAPKFNIEDAISKKAAPKTEPPKPAAPNFDFGKATRKTITPSATPSKSSNSNAAAEAEEAARAAQLASAAGQAIARVNKGLSTGIGEIGIPGPGGPAYASYNLALGRFYEQHWITPQTYTDNEPVVVAEVTIKGDGTVLEARIIKKSNRRALDLSVQKTLDRVKKAPPFPSGNPEEKRTFKVNFNLSSKLNIG